MIKHRALIAALISAASPLAHAAPPTSGAYLTDPQSEYVADQATEELNNATSVLCYLSNTRPDAMVNRGQYVAFIDEAKCDNEQRSDASQSTKETTVGTTTYTRMSLTSARESATSPQTLKGHAELNNEQVPLQVYLHISQTAAPSDSAPNGALTMNYSALLGAPEFSLPTGSKVVRGRITTSSAGVTYAEKGGMGTPQTNDVRLYVSGSPTTGSGAVFADYNGTADDTQFTFGYNSTHFCRVGTKSGVAIPESCFLRGKSNALRAVWSYGVYDATTGNRYDLQTPGFPVKNEAGQYGFASYWGIWFPTSLSNGTTLRHATNNTPYTYKKSAAKLTKHTLVNTTLNAINKNRFNFNTNAILPGTSNSRDTNYEAYWDAGLAKFVIVGQSSCTNSGCYFSKINPGIEMSATTLSPYLFNGLQGWSMSLGGALIIPPTTFAHAGSAGDNAVGALANGAAYQQQSVVKPGDAVPASLTCVRDCPTAAALEAYDRDTPGSVPFVNANSFGGTLIASAVSYTWSAADYKLSLNGASDAIARTSAWPDLAGTPYQYGVRSGALVDSSLLGDMYCPGGTTHYCDFKSATLPTFYTYETGPNDWNTASFLVSGSTPVSFTPPLTATYQVPNTAEFGEHAGATMNLQFLGFGQLQGIPGRCVHRVTHAVVDCGPNTSYYPAFTIPDGAEITIGGQTKYVKRLESELRFAPVAGTATTHGITLGNPALLPAEINLTNDSSDPSNPANTDFYPGAYDSSNFAKEPAVIQGVVQPGFGS